MSTCSIATVYMSRFSRKSLNVLVFGFDVFYCRKLIKRKCQSTTRPSIYFSLIVKSPSIPLLELTSTKQ